MVHSRTRTSKAIAFLTAIFVALSLFAGLDLTVVRAASGDGFHVSGTKILDANGNEFIMRGVNIAHSWYAENTMDSIDGAAKLGANTARIVVSDGKHFKDPYWTKTTKEELQNIIDWCYDAKVVCVLEVHDATGSNDVKDLNNAVEYWVEMADVLKGTEDRVIVNIANEWYGEWGSDEWANGYISAIPALRTAGIKNMIMVDCAGWGQYPKSIFDKGADVFAADPDKNTIFSIHMYEYAGGDQGIGRQGAKGETYSDMASVVRGNIDGALGVGVPVVIGEFGGQHTNGDVDEETIMSYCYDRDVGYLGWSWKGNSSDLYYLDITNDFAGNSLTEWGEKLFKFESYGIAATSETCSVFESGNHDPKPDTVNGSFALPAGSALSVDANGNLNLNVTSGAMQVIESLSGVSVTMQIQDYNPSTIDQYADLLKGGIILSFNGPEGQPFDKSRYNWQQAEWHGFKDGKQTDGGGENGNDSCDITVDKENGTITLTYIGYNNPIIDGEDDDYVEGAKIALAIWDDAAHSNFVYKMKEAKLLDSKGEVLVNYTEKGKLDTVNANPNTDPDDDGHFKRPADASENMFIDDSGNLKIDVTEDALPIIEQLTGVSVTLQVKDKKSLNIVKSKIDDVNGGLILNIRLDEEKYEDVKKDEPDDPNKPNQDYNWLQKEWNGFKNAEQAGDRCAVAADADTGIITLTYKGFKNPIADNIPKEDVKKVAVAVAMWDDLGVKYELKKVSLLGSDDKILANYDDKGEKHEPDKILGDFAVSAGAPEDKIFLDEQGNLKIDLTNDVKEVFDKLKGVRVNLQVTDETKHLISAHKDDLSGAVVLSMWLLGEDNVKNQPYNWKDKTWKGFESLTTTDPTKCNVTANASKGTISLSYIGFANPVDAGYSAEDFEAIEVAIQAFGNYGVVYRLLSVELLSEDGDTIESFDEDGKQEEEEDDPNNPGGDNPGGDTSDENTSDENTSGGSTGGDTSDENTSDENTSGGSTGGNTSDENTSGGSTGGNTSDSNTSGGSTGGNTSDSNTSGGSTSGDTSDENTSGGSTGGNTSDGNTSGGSTSGNTSDENTSGGSTGGNTSDGNTSGGSTGGNTTDNNTSGGSNGGNNNGTGNGGSNGGNNGGDSSNVSSGDNSGNSGSSGSGSVLAAPKSLKAKKTATNSVTLSWKKVKGATGYTVQQYVSKKWKSVKTIKKGNTVTAKIKKLKAGKTYKFKVCAKNGTTNGKFTKVLKVTTKPSKVAKFQVGKKTGDSVTLQWKKNASASGYKLQRQVGKKWKNVKTLNKKTATKFTVKKLKKNTAYKFRVRAFKKVGKKKVYGAYSKVTAKTAK